VAVWVQAPKAHRQRTSELVGNLILEAEDVVQTAIKMCRPNQGARGAIHELHRHPQPIRLALHAAADQISGIEAPADLARIDALGGKRERGIARDDRKPTDARQTVEDHLRKASAR